MGDERDRSQAVRSGSDGGMRVAVMGAGSWGTTFAGLLLDAGVPAVLWARRPEVAATINHRHENPDYLRGIALRPDLLATSDPAVALADATHVVLALPSQMLRANLSSWVPWLPEAAVFLCLAKGIEVGTGRRATEVVAEVAGVPAARLAVLSGPNLALEVAGRQPSASVVACADETVAAEMQTGWTTAYFRLYTNTDVVGVELGGAVKNVIAIAVGMAEGLGFGDNSKASLITRGLAETSRLGVALGADPLTFAGLAGLGDLVATCGSPLSRNRGVGVRLGRGEGLAQITAGTRMVAEGIRSSESILELSQRHGVAMPIVEHVVKVVAGLVRPVDVVTNLMSRELKAERPVAR